MLRITIEMVPGGNRQKAYVIYEGEISRIHTSRARTLGTYRARFWDKAGNLWKECIVEDFPRKRLLAWDLLRWVLNKALGGRT